MYMRGGFLKSFLTSDAADSVLNCFFPEVLEFLHVVFKLMQKHGPVLFSTGFHFVPFPHQYIL